MNTIFKTWAIATLAITISMTTSPWVHAACSEFELVDKGDHIEAVCIGTPLTPQEQKAKEEEDRKQEIKRVAQEKREAELEAQRKRKEAEEDRRKADAEKGRKKAEVERGVMKPFEDRGGKKPSEERKPEWSKNTPDKARKTSY